VGTPLPMTSSAVITIVGVTMTLTSLMNTGILYLR
jgi:hypothetical protein